MQACENETVSCLKRYTGGYTRDLPAKRPEIEIRRFALASLEHSPASSALSLVAAVLQCVSQNEEGVGWFQQADLWTIDIITSGFKVHSAALSCMLGSLVSQRAALR
jgi:hypothetical protein